MLAYSNIEAAIAVHVVPPDEKDIDLPELDAPHRLGVGRDGSRAFVLVGPGQAQGRALKGNQFRFDPWTQLADRRSGTLLNDVCVLRFWASAEEPVVLPAVAAVFAGLVDLARSQPLSLAAAIEAMEALFEAGLSSRVPFETEVGLAGELLVIATAPDPGSLISMWHSSAEGKFDFSAQGERLEVKTTSLGHRSHWFSSGQVDAIPGVCTSFVSVRMPLVEAGTTIASLFAEISGVSFQQRARMRSIILDTAKEPPEVLTSVVFDKIAAAASMLHVSPAAVPTPVPVLGVGRIRWEATLAESGDSRPDTCNFAGLTGL